MPPASEYAGAPVGDSTDLNRVLALPRRQRPDDAALLVLAKALRARLGIASTYCECESKFRRSCCCSLLPIQAWALSEAEQHQGLLGPIGVGQGKSLLDLLAPMVIPDCKVAVLLLPPQLKTQLLERDIPYYSQHWKLPNIHGARWQVPGRPMLYVVAYSELSGAKSSDLLTRINADLFILDEAHNVRNRSAARTDRLLRQLASHPAARVCAWSGTLASRSLKDYSHLAQHALGDGSPVPISFPVVAEWAAALDPGDVRKPPGALYKMCRKGEQIRDAFSSRLVDTPGVVTSPDSGGCQASLTINELRVVTPPKVLALLENLADTAERPDGELFTEALQVARCAHELSCGFYYRWRWPRKEPQEVISKWLEVRKEWHKEVRERLKKSSEFMDSPLLLTQAAIRWHDGYVAVLHDAEGRVVERKEYPPHSKNGPRKVWNSTWWPVWKATRDTAQPETETVWVDDFLVRAGVEWLKAEKGLLWYEHSAYGVAVAAACPEALYCGPGKEANLLLTKLTGTERCIMSIKSHGTGKQLEMFSRNLVANPPSSGALWEQLLGRTHRTGQREDTVSVEVFRHTKPFAKAVDTARELSEYISKSTFGIKQNLADRATWGF